MLSIIALFATLCYSQYTTSTLIDLSANPDEAMEGLTICTKTQNVYATGYSNGKINKLFSNGTYVTVSQFPVTFDGLPLQMHMTGIKCYNAESSDKEDVLLVNVFAPYDGSTNSPVSGQWKVTLKKNTEVKKKLFAKRGENVWFHDGLAIDNEHNGLKFDSDPQLGNIWGNKGDNDKYTLIAGTDAGSVPNYLQGLGVFYPLGSVFNQFGRGFGVNGLALDTTRNVLYAVNSEAGRLVSMSVSVSNSGDITIGPQTLVLSKTFQFSLDGCYYDDVADLIYVTIAANLTGVFTGGSVQPGNGVLTWNPQTQQEGFLTRDQTLMGVVTDIVRVDNYFLTTNLGAGLSSPRVVKLTPQ